MRILMTGGGTAGHVTPNIALMPALKEAGYDAKTLDGVVRVSFNSDTSVEDVRFAASKLNENALNLKKAMYNL